jgi:molybdopterin converting factor small subunit
MVQDNSNVEVKFLSTFYNVTKKEVLSIKVPEEADIDWVLDEIKTILGNEIVAHIRNHLDFVVIAVNNVDCRQLNGLKTRIKNGDRIVIGHIIAGG